MKTRFAVLLAGEAGEQLARPGAPGLPKPFFRLPGEDESLLQQSARAACGLVPAEQVVTVTTAAYAPLVRRQLRDIDPELVRHVLVEPQGMGTASACAVAAHYVTRLSEKALLWVLPGDHDRRPPLSLRQLREDGFAVAENGHILTFGIRPHSAEPGIAYLMAENDTVERFHGAPGARQAQEMVDSGLAWWSSGMVVTPAAKLLGYMRHLTPELHGASADAVHRGEMHERMLWLCAGAMDGVAAQSLDAAVMERVQGLRMHALDTGWSDIGTWPRLLAWWQSHAAHVPVWDFGDGIPLHYAELWEKMRQG